MNYLKNNYKNIIVLLSGLIVLSFGASIILVSDFGGDSITVFSQGLSRLLKIKYGFAYILGNLVFLTFMIFLNKKQIGLGTVLSFLLIGPMIDLFMEILPFTKLDNYILNFLFSFSGIIFAAAGLSLYMYSKTGLGVFEAFIDYFGKKFKIKFGYIKIVIDALLFILGVLMKGVFGITSIVSIIVLGPLIDLFTIIFNKTNIIKVETLDSSLDNL